MQLDATAPVPEAEHPLVPAPTQAGQAALDAARALSRKAGDCRKIGGAPAS